MPWEAWRKKRDRNGIKALYCHGRAVVAKFGENLAPLTKHRKQFREYKYFVQFIFYFCRVVTRTVEFRNG